MSSSNFHRCIENFTCEQCGEAVSGDGYTNHCPKCLWSKHVDINPGDRAAECQGAMEPSALCQKGGEYIIAHRCTRCGFQRNQRARKEDDFEALLALAER